MGGKGSGRRPPSDEAALYEHWHGKRTKMADVLTAAEVELLGDVVAPLQEQYDGPELGTRHEYPPTRTPKVSGHEPPDWLIEQRRLERDAYWLQRAADHARAMALDQGERERQRYHAAPPVTYVPPKRQRSVGLTIHCEGCGHRGRVVISPRMQRPWRLRCSQCGEPQEL